MADLGLILSLLMGANIKPSSSSTSNSIFHTKNLETKTPAADYSEYYLTGPYGKMLLQIHAGGIAYFRINDDDSQTMLGYLPWAAS